MTCYSLLSVIHRWIIDELQTFHKSKHESSESDHTYFLQTILYNNFMVQSIKNLFISELARLHSMSNIDVFDN